MSDTTFLLVSLPSLAVPSVLATLVDRAALCPHPVGAKTLLSGDNVPQEATLRGALTVRAREILDLGRAQRVNQAIATGAEGLWDAPLGYLSQVEVLLEPLQPGKLPPWVHFCAQHLGKHRPCVLVTVIATESPSHAVGDHFAFDERCHGLLPMERALSLQLHRTVQRMLLQKNAVEVQVYATQEGNLTMLLEAFHPLA